jgi:hypothetical protein
MKKRWPLLTLFLILAALALWLWRTNTGNTLAGPLTDFAVPDTASVDRIFIADKSGGAADLRRTPEGWTIDGLPAKDFQVNLLLETFKLVELKTPVPKSAEQNVLRVMAGTARKVEIYQGGNRPAKIWWVGQSTQDHFGTYMVLEVPGIGRSSVPFVMGMSGFTGVLNTRFTTNRDSWRSSVATSYPDLTKVTKVQVRQPQKPEESFTITYAGGNNLGLLDADGIPVPMDSAKVKDLMLHLRGSNFEAFERKISKAQRDSVLASPPWHVMTITSDKGVQRIPFWRKDPQPGERDMDLDPLTSDRDRMYALLNDTVLVIVQRYWFDRMVPPLSDLQAKAE